MKIHMIHRVLSMKKSIIIQLITIILKILDKATTDQMVLIKEMLHIDRLKPSLNKQKQSHYILV